MKPVHKIVTVLATLAVIAGTAVIVNPLGAGAAPLGQNPIYPEVLANPQVCRVEKLETAKKQLEYDQAKENYDRAVAVQQQGGGSPKEVRDSERALHRAAIALNLAKYNEAKCQNSKGNNANKVCIELALDLNRLIDELALYKELARLAKEDMDATPAQPAEAKKNAITAWRTAVIDREQAEQRVIDARKAIADEPKCKGFPAERPAPKKTTEPPVTQSPTPTMSPTVTPTTEPTTTTPPTTQPPQSPIPVTPTDLAAVAD